MYPGGDDPNRWQQPTGYGQQPPPGYGQYPQPGYGQPPAGQPPAGYGQFPPGPPPPSNQRSHILVIIGVAVVLMLVVVGFAAFMTVRSDDDEGTETAGPASSGSTVPPASPRDGLTVGSGPVKVDVYVDYQCPPCSTFEAATETALSGYVGTNRITLAIHPVAFIDDRSKNRYSTRAAAAMACAHEGGKTLDLHGHLLRNQPPEDTAGPTDEQLASTGATLGLGDGFRQCVIKGEEVTWVRDATTAAQSAGVSSVPAAFVNGEKIDTDSDGLTEAVDGAR